MHGWHWVRARQAAQGLVLVHGGRKGSATCGLERLAVHWDSRLLKAGMPESTLRRTGKSRRQCLGSSLDLSARVRTTTNMHVSKGNLLSYQAITLQSLLNVSMIRLQHLYLTAPCLHVVPRSGPLVVLVQLRPLRRLLLARILAMLGSTCLPASRSP